MDTKRFLLVAFAILLLAVIAAAHVENGITYTDFKHAAFTVGDGKNISLNGTILGFGRMQDITCLSNCTGFTATSVSTETNATNITTGVMSGIHVGTSINADNITLGTLADARLTINMSNSTKNTVYVSNFEDLQSALVYAPRIVLTDNITVTSTLWSNITQEITGIGYQTGLTGAANPLLRTDQTNANKLILRNLKIHTTAENVGVWINKTVQANPSQEFVIDTVWFHSAGSAGTLLNLSQVRESSIQNSLFTSATEYGGTATGININGTATSTINLNILNNHFIDLATGVLIDNQVAEGVKLIGNTMIGDLVGVQSTRTNALNLYGNMIDNVYYPLRIDSDNFDVSSNYFGGRAARTNVISINATVASIGSSRVSNNRIVHYDASPGNGINVTTASTFRVEYLSLIGNQCNALDTCIDLKGNDAITDIDNIIIQSNLMRTSTAGINLGTFTSNVYTAHNYYESDVTTPYTDGGTSNDRGEEYVSGVLAYPSLAGAGTDYACLSSAGVLTRSDAAC